MLLIIPNIALDITEQYSIADKAINILAPLGVYTLLYSLWKRSGIITLLLIPIMILCAFQIVLLFLYGESIIAVDMFLNVVTTNPKEAGELLQNLGIAIAVVCIIYLPLIVLGILAIVKKSYPSAKARTCTAICGGIILIAGIVFSIVAVKTEKYDPSRKLFPANVICNIFTAGKRTELSNNYPLSSSSFRYNAIPGRQDSTEIYVMVVGETSRADNWALNGYSRDTNPRLSHREGLFSFSKALSESNTTHKSVPLLMSWLGADQFSDSIYCTKSVLEAFNEAGFHTCWVSNQARNHSLIDFFGEQAEEHTFLTDDGMTHYDSDLCNCLRHELDNNRTGKVFVVLHSYGSHFNYRERYPEEFNKFVPDDATEATKENRAQLINAYDNSIRYTDAVLDSIFGILEDRHCKAAAIYLADHGEDIFDDARERFLHASPTPTFYQLHVPVLVWMSNEYRNAYPEKYSAVRENCQKNVSSSRSAFHTLLSLAGIDSPYYDPSAALSETTYTEPARKYLNDYNEAVPLKKAGLRQPDFDELISHNISY